MAACVATVLCEGFAASTVCIPNSRFGDGAGFKSREGCGVCVVRVDLAERGRDGDSVCVIGAASSSLTSCSTASVCPWRDLVVGEG